MLLQLKVMNLTPTPIPSIWMTKIHRLTAAAHSKYVFANMEAY